MLKPVSILHASSGHFRMSSCDRGGHFPAQGGKGPSHAPAGDSLVSVLSYIYIYLSLSPVLVLSCESFPKLQNLEGCLQCLPIPTEIWPIFDISICCSPH